MHNTTKKSVLGSFLLMKNGTLLHTSNLLSRDTGENIILFFQFCLRLFCFVSLMIDDQFTLKYRLDPKTMVPCKIDRPFQLKVLNYDYFLKKRLKPVRT